MRLLMFVALYYGMAMKLILLLLSTTYYCADAFFLLPALTTRTTTKTLKNTQDHHHYGTSSSSSNNRILLWRKATTTTKKHSTTIISCFPHKQSGSMIVSSTLLSSQLKSKAEQHFEEEEDNKNNDLDTQSLLEASNNLQMRILRLKEWAKHNGIKFADGIEILSMGTSGLGLVATRDFNDGEQLLLVPMDVAVTYYCDDNENDNNKHHYNDQIRADALFRNDKARLFFRTNASWYAQLAFQMVCYKKKLLLTNNDSNKNSDNHSDFDKNNNNNNNNNHHWRTPWIECLPSHFNGTPHHWSDDLLQNELFPYYPPIIEAIESDWKNWQNEYDQLIRYLKPKWKEQIQFSDFVWGIQCILSRVFSGHVVNEKPIETTTGTVTQQQQQQQKKRTITANQFRTPQKTEDPLSSSSSSSLSPPPPSTSSALVLAQPQNRRKGQRIFAVVPCIDMVNHSSQSFNSKVSVVVDKNDDQKRCFALSATTNIQTGMEILLSYGDRSNDELLRNYGFVEVGNPHDLFVLKQQKQDNAKGGREGGGFVGNIRLKYSMNVEDLLLMQRPVVKTTTDNDDKRNEQLSSLRRAVEVQIEMLRNKGSSSNVKTNNDNWISDMKLDDNHDDPQDSISSVNNDSYDNHHRLQTATLFRSEKEKILQEILQILKNEEGQKKCTHNRKK